MSSLGTPWILLHLALISSKTSGFFLWGMMLLPVVSSLGNEIKSKFWFMYRQMSMASLERVAARLAMPKAVALSTFPRPIWAATTLYFRRSEEHTSELQSRENLVCRLLLEKKK